MAATWRRARESSEPNRAKPVQRALRETRRLFGARRDERREPPNGGRHFPIARMARGVFLHESIYAFFLVPLVVA
jgi:hypothetical protein